MQIAIPKWTVFANIMNPRSPYVGIQWEFFDNEDLATARYEEHLMMKHVPTMRPWHPSDIEHMGAIHHAPIKQALISRS